MGSMDLQASVVWHFSHSVAKAIENEIVPLRGLDADVVILCR